MSYLKFNFIIQVIMKSSHEEKKSTGISTFQSFKQGN